MQKNKVFAIYLTVLFLNAFIDVGHKGIMINIIYKLSGPNMVFNESQQLILTSIVSALVLLPFITFFTASGYLSDRFCKVKIMRWGAFASILITLCMAYFYHLGNFLLSFFATFLLASQSAIYSPAKQGYVKEILGKDKLSFGNAYLLAVSLVAIIISTLFFAYIFEILLADKVYENSEDILKIIANIAFILVFFSILEFVLMLFVKPYKSKFSEYKFSFFKLLKAGYIIENIKLVRSNKITWYAIFGIAIFWAVSQNLLVIFQAYAKHSLNINNVFLAQSILILSIVGIIIGATLSGSKAKGKIKFENIFYGAILIITSSFILPFLPISEFLTAPIGLVFMQEQISLAIIFTALAILFFGLGSGMMVVPFTAVMQLRAGSNNLGVTIASKNWIQNIIMMLFLFITSVSSYFFLPVQYILYLNTIVTIIGFTIISFKIKKIY